jgi:thymidylate synthase
MIYNNAQEALIDLGTQLLRMPEQESRVGKTREMLMANITIRHPAHRCYVLPHRNDNIFAKIAETVWVLAGRNDVAWLSRYLPRAPEYSDDGKVWRAGYGTRMRHYGHTDVDQLANIITMLQHDRYTRRAVMSFWNPEEDYGGSKDYPCNDFIQAIIRKDKNDADTLYLTVTQRSSDILWGFSASNTFEFTILQTLLAHWLSCAIGTLTYNITSLHVYDRHYSRLDKIIKAYTYRSIYEHNLPIVGLHDKSQPSDDITMFDKSLPMFFLREQSLPSDTDTNLNHLITDNFLYRSFKMLQAYGLWQSCQPHLSGDLIDCLEAMPDDDWKLAVIEYIARDNKAVLDEVKTSDAIMTALLDCMPHLRDDR